MFESLCQDATWHVRHSVLFALPAILSRLNPDRRRQLALDVILPLSQDEESTVRSAVLEALGEVMYTFADDEGGPPEPLLNLFLGIRETEDPGGAPTPQVVDESPRVVSGLRSPVAPRSATSGSAPSSAWSDYGTDGGTGPDIYEDPQRPLVCAFNYPAVVLTLGRDRWPELRALYHSLVQNPSFKVRQTLAASLGEIAKIIGEEHARADLVDVFRSSLHAEKEVVRTKAVEALQTFVRALAPPERAEVARILEDAFSSGTLSSWREREAAAKAMRHLVEADGVEPDVLMRMVRKALDDRTAAVREAAVSVVSRACRRIDVFFVSDSDRLAAARVYREVADVAEPSRGLPRPHRRICHRGDVPATDHIHHVRSGDARRWFGRRGGRWRGVLGDAYGAGAGSRR